MSIVAINLPIVGPLLVQVNIDPLIRIFKSVRSSRSNRGDKFNGLRSRQGQDNYVHGASNIEEYALHEVYVTTGQSSDPSLVGVRIEDSTEVSCKSRDSI